MREVNHFTDEWLKYLFPIISSEHVVEFHVYTAGNYRLLTIECNFSRNLSPEHINRQYISGTIQSRKHLQEPEFKSTSIKRFRSVTRSLVMSTLSDWFPVYYFLICFQRYFKLPMLSLVIVENHFWITSCTCNRLTMKLSWKWIVSASNYICI